MLKSSVVSSNIQGVGWENDTLFVWFKTGKVYKYFKVPVTIYNELVSAPSVGRYFNEAVKHAFEYKDVTGDLIAA